MHKTDIYLSQAQLYHQHMESTTMEVYRMARRLVTCPHHVVTCPHHGWSRVNSNSVSRRGSYKGLYRAIAPTGPGEGNRVSFERSKSFPIKIYHDQGRE